MNRIGRAVVRVPDLEAAVSFYGAAFGFSVLFDREIYPGFRAVHVGPGGAGDAGIWLFPDAEARGSDEPVVVIYSDDFDTDVVRLRSMGAALSEVSREPSGRSVILRDSGENTLVLAEA
jgi:predicted enzyme related to lactoylglutathione lyase